VGYLCIAKQLKLPDFRKQATADNLGILCITGDFFVVSGCPTSPGKRLKPQSVMAFCACAFPKRRKQPPGKLRSKQSDRMVKIQKRLSKYLESLFIAHNI
jgi:hypothetical protein